MCPVSLDFVSSSINSTRSNLRRHHFTELQETRWSSFTYLIFFLHVFCLQIHLEAALDTLCQCVRCNFWRNTRKPKLGWPHLIRNQDIDHKDQRERHQCRLPTRLVSSRGNRPYIMCWKAWFFSMHLHLLKFKYPNFCVNCPPTFVSYKRSSVCVAKWALI